MAKADEPDWEEILEQLAKQKRQRREIEQGVERLEMEDRAGSAAARRLEEYQNALNDAEAIEERMRRGKASHVEMEAAQKRLSQAGKKLSKAERNGIQKKKSGCLAIPIAIAGLAATATAALMSDEYTQANPLHAGPDNGVSVAPSALPVLPSTLRGREVTIFPDPSRPFQSVMKKATRRMN